MASGVSRDSSVAIRYTIDGSEPTAADSIYRSPLQLSPELYSPLDLFRIQNAPDEGWYCPEDVEHIVVLRAALFDTAGRRLSPINTQSYIVSDLLGRTITLPVVSLCIDSASLYDTNTGIAVRGCRYDPVLANSSGNYFQRGREWERPVSFAFYDYSSGIPFTQTCGLRMHGSSQRARAQKGFSLYARREYGESRFNHRFFEDESLEQYKRLVLRPWRTSWSGAGIEDWLCQQIAMPLGCDHLATRPVVLFINGEYWGIYFLEEKADEHYVEEHYDVDHDWVNLLSGSADFVEHGSGDGWDELTRWLEQADLSNPDDYAYMASQVDIDNLMDYMLLQILVCNADWPANNVRIWSMPGGPWRWIFYDLDGTLAKYHANSYILGNLTCNDSTKVYPSSPQATLLFRRLLANPDFLERSIVRLGEISSEVFNQHRTSALLDDIVGQVTDEVPYQVARFHYPRSFNQWQSAIATIADFLKIKPATMTQDYIDFFSGSRHVVPPTLEVDPATGRAELHYQAGRAGDATLIIYDIYGRVVYRDSRPVNAGAGVMDLPDMQSGTYFVCFGDSGFALRWIVF